VVQLFLVDDEKAIVKVEPNWLFLIEIKAIKQYKSSNQLLHLYQIL
jgi:hypothetical protein